MALSTGSKIVVSDISTALNGKQNALGYTPVKTVNGSAVDGNGNVSITYVDSCNYANSAGRAFPKKTDGGDLNMNWHDHGGHPAYLWGGDDGTNMYVFPPGRLSVNYANSAGWANSANASAIPNVVVARKDGDGGSKGFGGGSADGTYYILPSGGTWRYVFSTGNDRHSAGETSGGSRVYGGSDWGFIAVRVG